MLEESMPKQWLAPSIESDSFRTPQVIVHHEIMNQNIARMAEFAKRYQLNLRPHIKTHKTPEIALLQLQHGAKGFTCAKISEAEALLSSPILKGKKLSFLIAFPIVGESNYHRVLSLSQEADILLMIDSVEQARRLQKFALVHQTTFSVLIKINTGLNRCGIPVDAAILNEFVSEISLYSHLELIGIMTHAGHSYGATNQEEREQIARFEGESMVSLHHSVYETLGINLPLVSVGSTPTVAISGTIPGVNEIRPGNYVFNDRTQVHLGSARWSECALRVISRVVSTPANNRWIIDAGSKTLALDQGAHGKTGLVGFGHIVEHPHLQVARLSEEHGVLEGNPSTPLHIGDLVEIIPNHACPVVNLTDHITVLKMGENKQVDFDTWRVRARGKNY